MMQESGKASGQRKILFVLGSGVSSRICPNVKELTDIVLSPDPKWFGYDQDEEFEAIVGFLKVLEEHAKPTTGECTYEDLFSMCDQLAKWELKRVPDPALRLFRDEIFEKSEKQWAFYAQEEKCYLKNQPLAAIAQKAQHAIHTVIRQELIGKSNPRKQLNLISEAIKKLDSENVDILTLNHDCLVEALLDREGIKWTDGFDPQISQDGDVINFDARAFKDRTRIRIVKLHGGCDWYYAGTSIENFRWVKADSNKRIDQCVDHNSAKFTDDPNTKPTLTGTTTKTASYVEGIHAELYLEARKLLKEYDRIICSGYGWNDSGFNVMLHEWATNQKWHLKERRYPRLLLLHQRKALKEFNEETKPHIQWFWPNNLETDPSKDWPDDHSQWMRCYPKWLSCTRFSEIEEPFFEE
jgi:hypothetical protein